MSAQAPEPRIFNVTHDGKGWDVTVSDVRAVPSSAAPPPTRTELQAELEAIRNENPNDARIPGLESRIAALHQGGRRRNRKGTSNKRKSRGGRRGRKSTRRSRK